MPDKTCHPPTRYVSHPEWLPLSIQEQKNKWKGIIIHHSATDAGDAITFDKHHKEANGWDELGYHFVISNGNNAHNIRDGVVEVGRRWKVQKYGAHCRVDPSDDNYWNEHTIGICLVGNLQNHPPTPAQYVSLTQLVKFLQDQYNISTQKILGHGDVYGTQTKCPGKYFSMRKLKRNLKG